MNQIGCSSFKFKRYIQTCITRAKKLVILCAKCPMKNHRGPTPDKEVPLSSRITLVSKQESDHYLAHLKQGHYGLRKACCQALLSRISDLSTLKKTMVVFV